jgi:hypothetical protein
MTLRRVAHASGNPKTWFWFIQLSSNQRQSVKTISKEPSGVDQHKRTGVAGQEQLVVFAPVPRPLHPQIVDHFEQRVSQLPVGNQNPSCRFVLHGCEILTLERRGVRCHLISGFLKFRYLRGNRGDGPTRCMEQWIKDIGIIKHCTLDLSHVYWFREIWISV